MFQVVSTLGSMWWEEDKGAEDTHKHTDASQRFPSQPAAVPPTIPGPCDAKRRAVWELHSVVTLQDLASKSAVPQPRLASQLSQDLEVTG